MGEPLKMSPEEIKKFIEDHYEAVKALKDDPEAWAEELEERIALGDILPPRLDPPVAEEGRRKQRT